MADETEQVVTEPSLEQVAEETPLQVKEGFDTFEMFKTARQETKDDKKLDDNPKQDADTVDTESTDQKAEDQAQKIDAQEPTDQTQVKPKARDYSLFKDETPEFQAAIKKTGGPAFDILKAIYTERNELKKELAKPRSELPPAYYSNPNGYLLHPEYGKSAAIVNQAEAIARHWKEQQISIKKTGKFRDLDQDPKTGKFIIGELKDASDEDEINVDAYLDHAKEQAQGARGKLNSIVQGFQGTYKEAVDKLRADEAKFFPDYDKPDHPTQKMQQATIAALPEIARGEICAPLVGKLAALASLQDAKIKELNAKLKVAEGLKKDKQDAPPTKSNFQGATNNKELSWDFFKTVRHESK